MLLRLLIWNYANGNDYAPVRPNNSIEIKGMGNPHPEHLNLSVAISSD